MLHSIYGPIVLDFVLNGLKEAFILLCSGDGQTWSAVLATLKATSLSMTASLVFGIPLGFLLGHFRFPGRSAVKTVVQTLLSLPTVFIGLLCYAFLSKSGPLGQWGLLFTLKGIAVGQAILALPIVCALSASAVEQADSRLLVTLLSLGATRFQAAATILWEVRRGLLAAAMTAFGRVSTEVGISMMVGGNIKWQTRTITTAIALETGKGAFSTGIALGICLLLLALIINLSVSILRSR